MGPFRVGDRAANPLRQPGNRGRAMPAIGVMEPPKTPTTTFGESPRGLYPDPFRQELVRVSGNSEQFAPTPVSTYPGLSDRYRVPQSPLRFVRDAFDRDPYGDRADEIGLLHGIYGFGHLGKLLQPPEWQPGDAPLNPERIEALYLEMREMARSRFQTADANDPNCQQRQLQFDNELRLHKLLRKERIAVYTTYCKRQRMGSEQDRSTLPPPGGRLARPIDHRSLSAIHSLGVQVPSTPRDMSAGKPTPWEIFHLSN